MSEQSVFLLVDDNDDDVLLVRRAFAKAKILNALQIVKSGEEAIDYLRGRWKYSNRAEYPLPALVLLDIKMPGINGFDVLRWVRLQPGLKALRIVMLTSSDDIRDVNTAYEMGANSFLIKPVDFEHFAEISQALEGYWRWTNEAPETFRPPAESERDTELLRRVQTSK